MASAVHQAHADPQHTELRRACGPVQLALYGIGSMLGAGIYGLIGQAAGLIGSAVWTAFLVSMVAALLTGLSYASIASRYPRAGGAAYVTQRAYRRPLVSTLVGLAVACSGLTSMATQSRVVAANLAATPVLAGAPLDVLAIGFLCLLAGVLYRGIRESLWFNALCTVVEASGLILVIAVGMRYWGSANLLEFKAAHATTATTALIVMQGAVLTFFSFIGFEDMLNVSEEVKSPERTMPIGVLSAMLIVTVIYMAVSVTAVSVVPWRELAEAPGPLTLVVERAAPWFPREGYTAITLFAVTNTALINYLMASRLLYGMARQGLMPAALGAVHPVRRTPHVAILVLLVIVAGLSLIGDISQLAAATVLLLLFAFTVVNGALVVLKRREGDKAGCFNAPTIVPVLGSLVCATLIAVRATTGDPRAFWIASALLLAILLFYLATARSTRERVLQSLEAE
jgi:amino acid transporter